MRMPVLLAARLSGGTHPRAISLAIFLGLMAGFVQGWNLSLAALCVMVVLFDVRSRVALTCWGIGLGLSWLLAPVTFLVGRVVLDLTPLGAWLGAWGDGQWGALFGWDRYTVVGGALIALVLAWPASGLATRGVRRTRRLLNQARALRAQFNPEFEPDVIAFPRSRMSRRARVGEWLRGEGPHAAHEQDAPLFRPGGMTTAAALLIVIAAGLCWHVPNMASNRLYLALQGANRARLEAGSFNLSLWEGRLEINDFRLADPDQLSHDRIRVAHVRADLDRAALLRGHLAVRRLDLSGIRTDVRRPVPAEPILVDSPPLAAASSTSAGVDDVLTHRAADQTSMESSLLESNLAHWPEVCLAIRRLGCAVQQLESVQEDERSRTLPLSLAGIAQTDLTVLRSLRSPLGRPRAKIAIASLRADDLDPAWQLGSRATLQAEQISSELALGRAPARFEIDAPDHATRLWAEHATHQGRSRWNLRLDARNLSVARQIVEPNRHQPLAIDGGQMALTGGGWANAEGFELAMRVHSRQLACHAVNRQTLAGISAEHWAMGLSKLESFNVSALCAGNWERPQLEIDSADLAENFCHQLRAANQHELLAAMQIAPETNGLAAPLPAQNQVPATAVAASPAPAMNPTAVAPAETPSTAAAPVPMPVPVEVAAAPQVDAAPTPVATVEESVASTELLIPATAAQQPAAPAATATAANQTPSSAMAPVATTTQAETSPPSAPGMPVIEYRAPAAPAATVAAKPVATPNTANNPLHTTVAKTAAIEGPGPVDLAVGHDLSTELWRPTPPQSVAAESLADTPASTKRAEEGWREPSTDEELDAWVQEQERAESRRESQFAKQQASPFDDNTKQEYFPVNPAEELAAKPKVGWLARVKSLWPFGGGAKPTEAIYELGPDRQLDEPARTARTPRDLPAEADTKWR